MGFGIGLGFEIYRWRAESDKPCRICLGLEGDHAEAPPRPHPYCECSITVVTRFDGEEPDLVREYTTRERTSIRYELLGIVKANQGLEVATEANWTVGSSLSNGILGSSFGVGGARTVNRTFTYDSDMGGHYQTIYDVIGIFTTRRTSVYRRASGEEVSLDEIESEEEIFLDTIQVESGDNPHYNEGGAGESEHGDDDDLSSNEDGMSMEDGMSIEDGWDD